ncbi:WxL domain-containing protein [Enterococcus sp. BWR-S5]|uniref:WxL domain-containing protein n=1 Tax=Enterococcus sp. BWR-S5 TaxID=2787714 RepID=UPI001924A0F4|nr:WxL domain-containing protein [Enterococcus sp. BWR-S5]MBL1227089.1 WxL domain-containing protein [Enterococcus sp. BWR-S5]
MVKKRVLLILSLLFSLVFAFINPAEGNAYIGIYPEPAPVSAASTPQEVADSKINVLDAFNFPGVWYAAPNGADRYNANYAFLSESRNNVAVLYNSFTYNQKGQMWYNEKLDLNYPFEFESYVFVGGRTFNSFTPWAGAANGLVFVMQNDPAGNAAIGGRGGGIGVWPQARGTYNFNMIYNSVGVELDTTYNALSTGNYRNDFDLRLRNQLGLTSAAHTYPHLAMATTKTDTAGYGTTQISEAYDKFTHIGPTLPNATGNPNVSGSEANSWFNQWIKLKISWEPNGTPGDASSITTGNLSYTFGPVDVNGNKIEYPTQTWSNIDIDATWNSSNGGAAWNRQVYWGFTGASRLADNGSYETNGTIAESASNPAAVAITKLPAEPEIDVDRKVINTTAGETESDYSSFTTAKVGDILQYKVEVTNEPIPSHQIRLKNTIMTEDLESNSYVSGSFNYSSSKSGATAPTPTVTGTNFTFTDTANEYLPGESFTYTYQVEVGMDTTEFINDVLLESTYSSRANYGETNVTVIPEGLTVNKTVSEDNPKVGEIIDVTSTTTLDSGLMLFKNFADAIPAGYELVPNTTKFVLTHKDNTKTEQALTDSDVWTGNSTLGYSLLVKENHLTSIQNKELYGGTAVNNSFSVVYQIKPIEVSKGERDVSLTRSSISGFNKVDGSQGSQEYSATSNDVIIDVLTDIILSFYDSSDALLPASYIDSSDSKFDGTNPVTLYYNTGDNYDLTDIIDEISDNLFTDYQLTLYKVEGDAASMTDISGTIKKAGNEIALYYSPDGSVIVKFVDRNGDELLTEVTIDDYSAGQTIDLTDPVEGADVLTAIQTIENNRYQVFKRPDNETTVPVTSAGTTVTYIFDGTLSIYQAPKVIDFGVENVVGRDIRVDEPEYDQDFIIWDNRYQRSTWYLTAELETPLTRQAGSGTVISDAIRYRKTNDDPSSEVILSSNAQEIVDRSQSTDTYNISDEWRAGNTGFKLEVPAGSVKGLGEYQATILWVLSETR